MVYRAKFQVSQGYIVGLYFNKEKGKGQKKKKIEKRPHSA